MLQYYASALSIPALIVVQGSVERGLRARRARRAPGRAARRPGRDPRLRARRQAPHPRPGGAQRPARARPGEAARPSAGASSAWTRWPACRRRWASTRCRCGSSASTSRTSAARTPSPRWSSSRAARRRRAITGVSPFARSSPAMITPRWRRSSRAATRSGRSRPSARPTTPSATRRSPRCRTSSSSTAARASSPPAWSRCRASATAASRSSRWPSASRRCSGPGNSEPIVLPHDTPELQLLQRVRDEAHRFAITHHRIRRDKAMTESIMDELPGIGPARKRALLKHFGSPEAVLGRHARGARERPGLPAEGRSRPVRPPQPDGTVNRGERGPRRTGQRRRAGSTLEDLVVISGL